MKNVFSIAFALLLLFISSADSPAQTGKAIVTPKKVVYRREGTDANEWRATFQIVYPQIKIAGGKAIAARITNALNYEKIFEFSLAEENGSLTSVYYKINYNKNGFLDVALFNESQGAYPWTETRYFVFDLKSGAPINTPELFARRAVGAVNGKIRAAMRREIKRRKITEETAFSFRGDFSVGRLRLEDLEGFSISDRGMTFIFDYNFNFASLADEPAGRYFFKWSELKPFIKPGGLLARFVR